MLYTPIPLIPHCRWHSKTSWRTRGAPRSRIGERNRTSQVGGTKTGLEKLKWRWGLEDSRLILLEPRRRLGGSGGEEIGEQAAARIGWMTAAKREWWMVWSSGGGGAPTSGGERRRSLPLLGQLEGERVLQMEGFSSTRLINLGICLIFI